MRKILLIACLAAFSCSESREMKPLKEPDRAAIPTTTGYVTPQGEIVAGPPLKNLNFAPSEGSCAPVAKRGTITACCDEKACNGHCVFAEDGRSKSCSCYGEAGGCKAGFLCSKVEHRCVKAGEEGEGD